MTDLVTGATGFIGSTLVRRLAADGRSVRVVVRSGARKDLLDLLHPAVEIRTGDVTDPDSLRGAFDGVRRVFHCAGRISFGTVGDRRKLFDVNVRGTANVLDAAADAGVARLVHVSSVAATGRNTGSGAAVNEDTPWSDAARPGGYGHSKVLAELEVQRAVAEGLDAVIVNPSLVFGVGRAGENTMRIVELVRAGRAMAYPAGAANVVDVEDVVTGMILAADRGVSGRRYLLGGENLTWEAILSTLAEALGQRPPRRRLPPAVLLAAGILAGLSSLVGSGLSGLGPESALTASLRVAYDCSRARSELGYHSRPFADTAARIAAELGP